MNKYPKIILTLMSYFKKLPGIGSKTAERFAFDLLNWNDHDLKHFANILKNFKESLLICTDCGCIKDSSKCLFCDASIRDNKIICIVANPKDVYAIEKTKTYSGLYQVIQGLMSPIDGFNIDKKIMENLEHRIIKEKISEMIIALDSTLEGDATSLYIKNKLKKYNLQISRLAFGLPVGSSLEYIDDGTLSKALTGRQNF